MRTLLRRLLSASTARLTLLLIAGAIAGYGFGYYFSLQLLACKRQNQLLTDDLNRAVTRGVTVEAHLILCLQREEASKK